MQDITRRFADELASQASATGVFVDGDGALR
jgi:hypothetical protein